MLIDMHAHTSGISRCCKADGAQVMRTAREKGIDGLVLSNHYDAGYVGNGGAAEFAQKYIDEFYQTAKVAAQMGMRLFFGVEVTARKYENAHILLYGIEPEFVREHPEVYDYTLDEMRTFVHEKGGVVVQAHPFRGRKKELDPGLLDGLEINCHPLYDSTHSERIQEIAQKASIFVTCGGDYHADSYRAVCGTYFPDEIDDYQGIVEHLKKSAQIRLHVHEVKSEDHRDVVFVR